MLTRLGRWPKTGERCLDLGASPGSWTWVLQGLGAHVLAVDRAPLTDDIAKLPHVTVRKQDAFLIQPEELAEMDWIFSDVICYPEKLLDWIQKCLALCTSEFCLHDQVAGGVQPRCDSLLSAHRRK